MSLAETTETNVVPLRTREPSTDSGPEQPRLPMDWLEEPSTPAVAAPGPAQSAADAPGETDGDDARPGKSRLKLAGILLLCAVAVLYFLLPSPQPKSPALELERNAPQDASRPLEIGEAKPLTPPANRIGQRGLVGKENLALPAPTATAQTDETAQPVVRPALSGSGTTGPDPAQPAANPTATQTPEQPVLDVPLPAPAESTANALHDELAAVGQRLDMIQALVERLERSERVLTSPASTAWN